MRRLSGTMLGLLAAATVGCTDLGVENNNSPDRDRALARPTDVEGLAGSQYRVIHNALWSTGGIEPQLAVMGMESFSTNANFGMGVRSGIPRSGIDNGRGNPADFYNTWLAMFQVARTEALALGKLNDPAFTFFPTSAAQKQRARAFGYFVKGVALGYAAMMFDSGPIVQPDDDIEATNPFVDYNALLAAAFVDLDSAIAIASLPTPAGLNGFPLPATWMNGASLSLTGGATGNFVRMVRGFKARFRSSVARTPADRALVDWAAVIADAAAALPSDMTLTMSNVTGGWFYAPVQMNTFQSWHQMWPGIVGMSDTSGNYTTWLNQPRTNKLPFNVLTSDTRFPSGGNVRTAQNAASGCVTGTACTPPAGQYYRNRLNGQDNVVDGLFHSYYDYHRFQLYYNGGQNGPVTFFPRAEMDMLVAEGQIRLGQFGLAMAAINPSRVAHGLPALVGITTLADPIPGGAVGCTPHVPTGATNQANATPGTIACGNIMEAMKYEKRHETAFTVSGQWYFDGRGWGDLPVATPIQFPVPYTELDARGQVIYSAPTVNAAAAASYTAAERLSNSASNYGFGSP